MIKIIKGVYGHQVGKSVQPKSAASEPFSLEPEQEERLVKRGVAEYVADPTAPSQLYDEDDNDDDLSGNGAPTYNKGMKTDVLKGIAKVYGVSDDDLSAAKNRSDIVALIDKSRDIKPVDAETDNGTDDDTGDVDGEPAPSFSAAEPVQ